MKQLKKLLACAALLLISAAASAQIKVTGVVSDAQGEPVIGATVREQGTTTGVVTDLNGRYEIQVKSDAHGACY